MRPSDCPCRECGEREVGCHGRCASYGEWKQEMEKKRHADKLFTQSMRTMSDAASRWLTKEKHRRNKKRMHVSHE